jgi:predicted protein tyrosine phosphatase
MIDGRTIKPYLKNDLFEGIVSWEEYLLMYNADVLDKFNTVLISIHDPNRAIHPESKVMGFDDVLQMQFWDVESQIGRYHPLTDEQGTEIREFIEKNKDKRFLIHCAAGVSRSAGVGCAVECIVNFDGDDYGYKTGHSDIKPHDRYFPNFTVYDAIVKDIKLKEKIPTEQDIENILDEMSPDDFNDDEYNKVGNDEIGYIDLYESEWDDDDYLSATVSCEYGSWSNRGEKEYSYDRWVTTFWYGWEKD